MSKLSEFFWALHLTSCEAFGNIRHSLSFKLDPLRELQELRVVDCHQTHTTSVCLNFHFCRGGTTSSYHRNRSSMKCSVRFFKCFHRKSFMIRRYKFLLFSYLRLKIRFPWKITFVQRHVFSSKPCSCAMIWAAILTHSEF